MNQEGIVLTMEALILWQGSQHPDRRHASRSQQRGLSAAHPAQCSCQQPSLPAALAMWHCQTCCPLQQIRWTRADCGII